MAEMTRKELLEKLSQMEASIQQKTYTINADENNTKDIKMNRKYAVCFGGGGGKGAYQIGVYQAIVDYGLLPQIHAVSGTSIGALNAMLLAMRDLDNAVKAWDNISLKTVFSPDADLLFNGSVGMFSRNEMLKMFDQYLDFDRIRQSGMDIYVNVSVKEGDINKPLYLKVNELQKSDIIQILSASSAMPIIYESISYQGMQLSDGGLTDNIPVKPLYENGCQYIILCGLNPAAKKNLDKYPDADFIEIYPSVNLGDTFQGTLNFSRDALKFRKMLGYKDAMRAFRAYFEADPQYIATLEYEKENDIREIRAALKITSIEEQTQSSVKSVRDLYDRYDIP